MITFTFLDAVYQCPDGYTFERAVLEGIIPVKYFLSPPTDEYYSGPESYVMSRGGAVVQTSAKDSVTWGDKIVNGEEYTINTSGYE